MGTEYWDGWAPSKPSDGRTIYPEESRALVVRDAEQALVKIADEEKWARKSLHTFTTGETVALGSIALSFGVAMCGAVAAVATGGAGLPIVLFCGSGSVCSVSAVALKVLLLKNNTKAKKILAIADGHRAVIKQNQALLESPERAGRGATAEEKPVTQAPQAESVQRDLVSAAALAKLKAELDRGQIARGAHMEFKAADNARYLLRVTESEPYIDESGARLNRIVARVCHMPLDGAEYASAKPVDGIALVVFAPPASRFLRSTGLLRLPHAPPPQTSTPQSTLPVPTLPEPERFVGGGMPNI